MNKSTIYQILKWSLSLGLLFGMQNVMAQYNNPNCTYDLRDGRGIVLQKFFGFNYNSRWLACDNARNQCQAALISYRRQNPGAYCIESGRYSRPTPPVPPRPVPPRPPRDNFQCTSHLHRYDGRILQTFYGAGYNQGQACRQARQKCESHLRRSRHNRGSYCSTNPNPRRPRR